MTTTARTEKSLDNRVALVTGGARRVGRAIALRLARAGMHVAITYQTSGDAAASLVRSIRRQGRKALAIQVDLAASDAADQVHADFTKRFGRLDALVNNASTFKPGALGGLQTGQFDLMMAVNARAPVMLMKRFSPMLAEGFRSDKPHTAGRVVNFIDIHVLGEPLGGYLAYNCSKAALHEATKTAAIELAPKITVNAIAPGVVAWADSYTAAQRREYLKRVPLGREGTPLEAAEAVLYFVRDATYCTGQVLRLDGGRLLT